MSTARRCLCQARWLYSCKSMQQSRFTKRKNRSRWVQVWSECFVLQTSNAQYHPSGHELTLLHMDYCNPVAWFFFPQSDPDVFRKITVSRKETKKIEMGHLDRGIRPIPRIIARVNTSPTSLNKTAHQQNHHLFCNSDRVALAHHFSRYLYLRSEDLPAPSPTATHEKEMKQQHNINRFICLLIHQN